MYLRRKKSKHNFITLFTNSAIYTTIYIISNIKLLQTKSLSKSIQSFTLPEWCEQMKTFSDCPTDLDDWETLSYLEYQYHKDSQHRLINKRKWKIFMHQLVHWICFILNGGTMPDLHHMGNTEAFTTQNKVKFPFKDVTGGATCALVHCPGTDWMSKLIKSVLWDGGRLRWEHECQWTGLYLLIKMTIWTLKIVLC